MYEGVILNGVNRARDKFRFLFCWKFWQRRINSKIFFKNGVVKVRSIGFLGEDEAIPEVSAMLELANK